MSLDILLLLAVVIGGLIMIPLGLPGIWLMVLAGLVHSVAVTPPTIGTVTLVAIFVLAAVAEWLEFSVSRKYTTRYGGSSRAAWGAILGGIAGAMLGIPIPVIGSVIGAFAGSFAGALLGEYSVARDGARATQAAKGALIGRAVATALKSVTGCVIGFWLLAAAWR